jgi:parvulin-like peptidyl-prolyl isomerase
MENPPHGGRGAAAGGFGALSIDYSDDQASRYRGGDIGWMDPGKLSSRYPRKVMELGDALEKGKMSEVIEVEGGLYVVMKTDARDASVMSLQKVEPALRQDLLQKKRCDLEAAYRKESTQWAEVSINREALASVKLLSGAEAQAGKAEPSILPTLSDSEQGH